MGRVFTKDDGLMVLKEACGVIAANSSKGVNVIPKLLRGLESLQHRGQESWGIAIPGKPVFKRMGLVVQWYTYARELEAYKGGSGIGHVRYSTKGKTTISNAHPIQIGSEFSIAHNGTIVNTEELARAVSSDFPDENCDTDTKIAGLRLLQILREEKDWFETFKRLGEELIGAYTFVILHNSEVFAARDPRGYRPLCLGWHEGSSTYLVASESCAFTTIDAAFVRDIKPGEVVRLGGPKSHFESFRFAPAMESAYCSFEYTYFAHPSSRINGVSVYEARKRVGKILAQKSKSNCDVVIPVPDSARPAALGYSMNSGIPMDEGLMKDRYRRKGSIRSFIEPRQQSREEVVKQIIPIKEAITAKSVVVVDDSVVRGTSSKAIIKALRKAGAKKIKMAVTFPPILHPCYMGIDFPTQEELIAYQVARDEKSIKKIGDAVGSAIGVDELHYNDIDGLAKAIGLPRESLCFSCITGDYSKLGVIPPLRRPKERKVD
jgi:amidophosphoribosyltransferase